jgi:hypothetical protein
VSRRDSLHHAPASRRRPAQHNSLNSGLQPGRGAVAAGRQLVLLTPALADGNTVETLVVSLMTS